MAAFFIFLFLFAIVASFCTSSNDSANFFFPASELADFSFFPQAFLIFSLREAKSYASPVLIVSFFIYFSICRNIFRLLMTLRISTGCNIFTHLRIGGYVFQIIVIHDSKLAAF